LPPPSQTSPDTIQARHAESSSGECDYGFSENPFVLSSDPKFFYRSASHDRALTGLLAATQAHQGVVVLTGAPGLGKTMLCRIAAHELNRRTVTSIVFDPILSVDELLRTVLIDFGVISGDDLARAPGVSREVLAAALGSFLESLVSLNATAVVMIDEAQNVPPAVLAELPAAFAAVPGAHPVQLVLVAQPGLSALLERPELRLLASRIDLRLELRPLAGDEIGGYVTHRLSVAGGSAGIVFSEAAFARIAELSRGVPRVVNLLCAGALSHGSQASATVIDARLVDVAARDLDLALPAGYRRTLVRGLVIALASMALVLAGAAGAAWMFRDEAARVLQQWMEVPTAPPAPVPSLPAPIRPIPAPADAWSPGGNLFRQPAF
jgi:general secretion pathway protein A